MTKLYLIECNGYRNVCSPDEAQSYIDSLRSKPGCVGKTVRIWSGEGRDKCGTFNGKPAREAILSAQ